jgi:lambda repressor-like predicted transcriptional regulator
LPLQQFANIFAREYRKVDLIVARFLDLCHPGIWIGCDADDLRKLHLRIQKNI